MILILSFLEANINANQTYSVCTSSSIVPDNVLDLGAVYRTVMSTVQSGKCIELEHDPQRV